MIIECLNQPEHIVAWPVSPSFLVKSVIPKKVKYSLNRHGVYDADTIRGFIADASDDKDIQNPLSLLQVVPDSCEFEDFHYVKIIEPAEDDLYLNDILERKKVIRIYPSVLYKSRACCRKFRVCNGYENKCHMQDCRIALLYHKDLDAIHYTNNFDDYYKKLIEIVDEYNRNIAKKYQLHCERDEECKRLYVWYQCPYSKFYEYFFPIIHSGKVIAVLMQGQRIPKTLNRDEIFQNVLKDTNIDSQKKDDLRQSIIVIPDDEFGKEPMSQSRRNAICKRIQILEKRIDEMVMAHVRFYISDNFHRIERGFRKQIEDEIKSSGELTNRAYKEIVNSTLRKICYIFNKKGFIRIYSTDLDFKEEKSKTDTFYLIGASSELTESEEKILGKIVFHDLPSDVDALGSMENEKFSPYLNQKIDLRDDMIFRIDSLSIGNVKHLIWSKYPNKNDIDQKQFNEFDKYLKMFYHTLWEPYNLLCSVKLRRDLETSIRISVHETSQIIPVIINTLQHEYKLDTMKLIREDRLSLSGITQREHTLYDTINRLLLLDNLYRRSTLMFKELIPENRWTDLHRLIYSVRNLCDEKALKNNMQKIIVKSIDGFNISQYKIYTDYQLISHALFNLIDNALKYGYMGSNININISLSEADLRCVKNDDLDSIKSLQISIISYGVKISKEDEKHMYELFYRSKASKVKDGMGIGLFLVKKICNALGYTVEYKGRKLSEYNLPIYYYGKEQKKTSSLRAVSPYIIGEAVNIDLSEKDWYIEDLEFDVAIYQPTYRNEFIVTLNKIDNNLIKRI